MNNDLQKQAEAYANSVIPIKHVDQWCVVRDTYLAGASTKQSGECRWVSRLPTPEDHLKQNDYGHLCLRVTLSTGKRFLTVGYYDYDCGRWFDNEDKWIKNGTIEWLEESPCSLTEKITDSEGQQGGGC